MNNNNNNNNVQEGFKKKNCPGTPSGSHPAWSSLRKKPCRSRSPWAVHHVRDVVVFCGNNAAVEAAWENLTLFHCIGMQCIFVVDLWRVAATCTNLVEFLCGQLVFMVEKYGGASRISPQAVGWQAGLLVSTLYCSSWCFSRCNSAQLKMLQCARMYLGFVFGNLYGN